MTPDVGEISNVWDYVNPLDEEALSKSFHAAKPFRFICVDDFLNSEFCHEVCQAYPSYRDAERNAERQFLAVNENRKLQIVDSELFPKSIRILKDALAAPELLQTLSRITGIPDLQADPELAGGGMHVMGPGSRLDVHVDFNMLVERKLHRRLNIVLYLNEGWQETWGGLLDVWDPEVKHCEHALEPVANRAMIFNTVTDSFHGVTPVQCPPDRTRNSFASFYYTSAPPPDWDGKAFDTIWAYRPDERWRRFLLAPPERLARSIRRVLHLAERKGPGKY